MNKAVKVILVLGVAGAAAYYFYKKSKANTTASPSAANKTAVPVQDSELKALDNQAFSAIKKVLEADAAFANGFPGTFYPAVEKDYQNQLAGNPRDAAYNSGKTSSLMSVADAWQSAMKFSDQTHEQMWKLYNAYLTQYNSLKLAKA